MASSDSLKQLMPLDLGPDADSHLQVIGEQLDKFLARVGDFKRGMFIAGADELITEYEKDYGIDNSGKPLQARREIVAAMKKAKGGLSKQHFLDLAASRGYSITIKELSPLRAGFKAGARVFGEEAKFIWQVTIDKSQQRVYHFRAGSKAGQRLVWKDDEHALESIFERLKPAWTYVTFIYESSGMGHDGIGEEAIGG